MANPQLEHGHLALANEIVEALARTRISGTEWQLLWVILRKTYGWHKKLDAIPLSQFHEMTGLPKPHITRYLKKLLRKRVIFVARKSTGAAIYGFNKDFESWQPMPKKKGVRKEGMASGGEDRESGEIVEILSFEPSSGESSGEPIAEGKEKETYGLHVKLTKDEHGRLVSRFGADYVVDVIEFFDLKIESKGAKQWRQDHESDYATILYWERNGWIAHGRGESNRYLSASSQGIVGWAERERERLGIRGK